MKPEQNSNGNLRLTKTPTGIDGFDHIAFGGLPAGRPTLIAGGPGCGKTVFGMEFLVHGARDFDEPGLFVSFEVNQEHLLSDFRSMNLALRHLIDEKKLKILQVDLDPTEIVTAGDFSLDALILRLEAAIDAIGAERLVLDTMEKIYSVLPDSANLRQEIGHLFDWIRQKGLTTVVTGESGDKSLTKRRFEAYISDCVILLDHRIVEQISNRQLRILKYRGSEHGTDEYPFVIGEQGFSVFPITTAKLDHKVSQERVSTGIEGLDEMFGGQGYFRGSSVMAAGKAGTGKSTLSAAFARAACKRGENVLYLAFEESPDQIIRNMRSVNIDLQPCRDQGLLHIDAFRPSLRGLEEHLIKINNLVDVIKPECVVMDPLSGLTEIGTQKEVKAMLTRTMDILKSKEITLFATVLTPGSESPEETEVGISSLMDTWIALDYVIQDSIRLRYIYIVKSR
ncbi:MAG: circadian clock protein KaiC, partial [Brevefilum sp.]